MCWNVVEFLRKLKIRRKNNMKNTVELLGSKDDICSAFVNFLRELFVKDLPSIQNQLTLFCVATVMLNACSSLRFLYMHALNMLTNIHINNFYNAINNESHQDYWRKILIQLALSVMASGNTDLPILLIIDDTLVEKYGKKFDDVATLYDHCARTGSNYLNGHCFVSLILGIPVLHNGKTRYIRVPIEHRLWIPNEDKTTVKDESNKLQLAYAMISEALDIMGSNHKYAIFADAWYAKAPITHFIQREDIQIGMVCATRVDAKLYHLPGEYKGKGRRPLYGDEININKIPLSDIPGTKHRAAHIRGKARIFGNVEVSIFVTEPKSGGKRRVFIATDNTLFANIDPAMLPIDKDYIRFLKDHIEFLPLATYCLRWMVEVVYYEQKMFWGLQNYRLRSENGFITQINLNSVLYGLLSLIPFLDKRFEFMAELSVQERRFKVGEAIRHKFILATFAKKCESLENITDITNVYENTLNEVLATISQ